MLRDPRPLLLLSLALAAGGCASSGDPGGSGPVFDPWASRWEAREVTDVATTRSWVAWPTGDRETADLTVEKFFPAEPRPGRPFEGRLVVTNLTGSTLAGLVITERLAPGFRLTASAPQGRSSESGVYRWELGAVGPGQSRTIRISGRAETREPLTSSTSARYTRADGEGGDRDG